MVRMLQKVAIRLFILMDNMQPEEVILHFSLMELMRLIMAIQLFILTAHTQQKVVIRLFILTGLMLHKWEIQLFTLMEHMLQGKIAPPISLNNTFYVSY